MKLPLYPVSRAPGHRRLRVACAAFTLIEVLLAVGISAIVLAAINVVFFGAVRLREGAAAATKMTLPLDNLVSVMKRDLRGIMPYSGNSVLVGLMASDTTAVGMSQPVALEIYTSTGQVVPGSPYGEIQRIDYALQDPTNRMAPPGRDIVRHVSRNLLAVTPEAPVPQHLISGVQTLQFSYYDGTNWATTWSSTLSNTPIAVKVHIDFTPPRVRGVPATSPIDFLVPVIMVPRTNTAASLN